MDTSDPVVFASVATAALVLFLFIWRIVFFFTADADLTLLLKGPPPEGAFEDKVVWITGASQGIGQELAQRFAAMGARLILSSRSADRLEAVRATCRGKHAPEGVVVLPFDLKGGADVLRGAVRQAESAFRGEGACGGGEEPCGVDVLVLNAAHPRPGRGGGGGGGGGVGVGKRKRGSRARWGKGRAGLTCWLSCIHAWLVVYPIPSSSLSPLLVSPLVPMPPRNTPCTATCSFHFPSPLPLPSVSLFYCCNLTLPPSHSPTHTSPILFPPPLLVSLRPWHARGQRGRHHRAHALPPAGHDAAQQGADPREQLTRYLLLCMMQRIKGQILVVSFPAECAYIEIFKADVWVSSAAGKLPAPTQGVFAATKHAPCSLPPFDILLTPSSPFLSSPNQVSSAAGKLPAPTQGVFAATKHAPCSLPPFDILLTPSSPFLSSPNQVSSAAGKLPAPTQGVYAATKHALHGYFNTLRYEAVQHGVAVTLVCPGPIATEGSAEGAVKLATKPSADQLHVPAAAGGDEKVSVGRCALIPHTSLPPHLSPLSISSSQDSCMPASQCAELIVSATACSSLSPSSLHPTHCSASCPPHLAPHFPSLSTGLAHASIAMCRAHSERCCLEARRSMDLQTSGAATHVPRTVFPCYLQHALQQDWPKESASTQDRQQQHVFDEPTIHPHILFLFLLTHLSFLLPPLDLLYLFPQPFTLPHTPTPCNPSTPQVPIFPIPHPHTFPHTLTHTSAKVYHPLPSFLPSSLLFPSLLPLLSISLPLIPLTRPLSPPFTHLGPSPPLLA
ncbi:unnamed protein product [Closterium sp. NIES-54]